MATARTGLTCCAGEHFVAYKLSTMDLLVALTRSGAPAVDLMVASPDGQKTVAIQVKTARWARQTHKTKPEENGWCWNASAKEKDIHGKLFYAFVDLKESDDENSKEKEMPDVFIVPAEEVPSNLYATKKNDRFFFFIDLEDGKKWLEAWHLITNRLEMKKLTVKQ